MNKIGLFIVSLLCIGATTKLMAAALVSVGNKTQHLIKISGRTGYVIPKNNKINDNYYHVNTGLILSIPKNHSKSSDLITIADEHGKPCSKTFIGVDNGWPLSIYLNGRKVGTICAMANANIIDGGTVRAKILIYQKGAKRYFEFSNAGPTSTNTTHKVTRFEIDRNF